MRLALAGFLLAAFATSAGAQEAAAPPNPIQALENCVLTQAKRLEVSGEAADIVAVAAVDVCGRQLTAASTSTSQRTNIEMRQQLKDMARETALTSVVEIRAQRKTPKPAVAAKPKPKPKPKKKT